MAVGDWQLAVVGWQTGVAPLHAIRGAARTRVYRTFLVLGRWHTLVTIIHPHVHTPIHTHTPHTHTPTCAHPPIHTHTPHTHTPTCAHTHTHPYTQTKSKKQATKRQQPLDIMWEAMYKIVWVIAHHPQGTVGSPIAIPFNHSCHAHLSTSAYVPMDSSAHTPHPHHTHLVGARHHPPWPLKGHHTSILGIGIDEGLESGM